MLLPQALAGVGSVVLLGHLVRRWRGEIAGLLAALAFALTPVAVLIFRYNNPDAFLTLLLLLATWSFWSALEKGSSRRLVLTGVILGFAFLTKMLMGLIVVPALGITYLVAGPPKLGKRVLQLLAALGALIVSAGWWLAAVELWPAASRPHVGGTTTDSWISLILGRTAGVLDTASSGANLAGNPGWLRIFNAQLGGQVAWLLPLALTGMVAGLAITFRRGRCDRQRAGYLLWGLWTVVTIAVFSEASGTLHSYYTVVLAPGIAALVGAAAIELWDLGRRRWWFAWVLPAAIAGTAVLSAVLLGRVSGYAPGLPTAILILGLVGAVGVFASLLLRVQATRPAQPTPADATPGGSSHRRLWYYAAGTATVISLVALMAGPFAYSASTVARSVTGNTAAAGPQTSGPNAVGNSTDLTVDDGLVSYLEQNRGEAKYLVAVQTTTESVPLILATGEPVMTIGGYKSRDPYPTATELEEMVKADELRYILLINSSEARSSVSSPSISRDILSAVTDWVEANGTVVDPSEYGGSDAGTLYLLGA